MKQPTEEMITSVTQYMEAFDEIPRGGIGVFVGITHAPGTGFQVKFERWGFFSTYEGLCRLWGKGRTESLLREQCPELFNEQEEQEDE